MMNTFKIKDIISQFSKFIYDSDKIDSEGLFFSGIDSLALARKEIEILLMHVLNKDKVFLRTHDFCYISEYEFQLLTNLVERRAKGEPLAYLLGKKEFFGYDFYVDNTTLIPRADTEILIETALEYFKNKNKPIHIADFGTGTGCILLTLLKELEQSKGIGIDIAKGSISLAMKNCSALDLDKSVMFFSMDFTDKNFFQEFTTVIQKMNINKFDLVISNPPYIPENEYTVLDNSVKNYEPKTALYSPNTKYSGLYHIEKVIELAEKLLNQKGLLLIEHGYNQGKAVRESCYLYDFDEIKTGYDYGGNERFLYAVKK